MSTFVDDKKDPANDAVAGTSSAPDAASATASTTIANASSTSAPVAAAPVPAPAPAPAPVVTTSVVTAAAPVAAAPVAAEPSSKGPDDLASDIENMTIFGNKSLEELQRIQERRSHLSAGIKFDDPSLMIPAPILKSLTTEMRFEKPSEIQASTLPIILGGNNLIAQAQSGAGKTIAFTTGMLARIDPSKPVLQALALAPTREVVKQIIADAVRPLSSNIPGIRIEAAIKGVEIEDGAVSRAHLVVGTPGTVKNWIKERYLRLDQVKIFVLDEADNMVAEKSLGGDTVAIRNRLPPTCQVLLFSATYAEPIVEYAQQIVPEAYLVRPKSREELILDVIFQLRIDVRKCRNGGGKLQVLKDIYSFLTMQQSIVFVSKKTKAEELAAMMRHAKFDVTTFHGDLTPEQRDLAMLEFRAGKTKVLIATSALARGVDVPAVAVVVNYDLPTIPTGPKTELPDEATYLHRIGRCGRFGRRGTAISFLETPYDFKVLETIERYYSPGKRITMEWDPNDIEGLSDAIKERPSGGEILPEALDGNSAITGSNISLFSANKQV